MIAELETQPIAARRPTGRRRGCLGKVLALVLVGILASVLYLTLPGRIEVLLLGLDRAPDGSDIARTDTMIYLAAWPAEGRAALLSIPRDLWVAIPGVGENRINAAHFFAEAETAGRGPYGAMTTINQHFGTDARYFVRVRFSAVESFVDAMGGLSLRLESPMGGLPAGEHRLSGTQALAFVRNRQGTDDFFRMAQAQVFIRALLDQLLEPRSWPVVPLALAASRGGADTNLPLWQWPRLAIALLRAGGSGIETFRIEREMVTGFVTQKGAQVLAPHWGPIRELVGGMLKVGR